MKKIILFLMVWSVLMPVAVKAEVTPELNPLCWRKQACDDARKGANSLAPTVVVGDGWINETPCIGEWGKCLPAGKTRTEIAFGGKTEFENIGEFLKTNYNFAIALAGILAVIMIIIAGVQWTTSGGNSEMISSAKKRIGGALIGLLIAYLSYSILNTINPALVNLRLPQSFMIRAMNLVVAQNCVDLEKPWKVAPTKGPSDIPPESAYQDPFIEASVTEVCKEPESEFDFSSLYPARTDLTECGKNYLVKDGGNATCAGTKCPDGQVCRDQKCGNLFPGASGVGGIAGKIKYEAGKFIDAVYLKVVCKDGTVSLSSGQTVASNITIGDDLKIFGFKLMAGDKPYNFDYVDILEDSTSVCNSQDNVLGYYLELEINDDDYPISNLGYSTDDIWNGGISMCSNITGSPSCGFSGANDLPEPDEEEIIANAIARVGQYIPFESIKKGFVCDFDINKNTTPNVGKSLAGIAGKGILDILLSDSLFDPKSNKITAAFEKGGIFSVNHYISGANYQCSSFDKSASEYKDKLKKRACKCWDTPVISAGYKAKHTKAEVCGGN